MQISLKEAETGDDSKKLVEKAKNRYVITCSK